MTAAINGFIASLAHAPEGAVMSVKIRRAVGVCYRRAGGRNQSEAKSVWGQEVVSRIQVRAR
jgi:hypothetical protein